MGLQVLESARQLIVAGFCMVVATAALADRYGIDEAMQDRGGSMPDWGWFVIAAIAIGVLLKREAEAAKARARSEEAHLEAMGRLNDQLARERAFSRIVRMWSEGDLTDDELFAEIADHFGSSGRPPAATAEPRQPIESASLAPSSISPQPPEQDGRLDQFEEMLIQRGPPNVVAEDPVDRKDGVVACPSCAQRIKGQLPAKGLAEVRCPTCRKFFRVTAKGVAV